MALDKLIDSGKLNTGLEDTAWTIAHFMMTQLGLATQPTLNWYTDPKPVYYQNQLVGAPSGFAADIFDIVNANEPTGGGIKVVSGTKTLTEAARRFTVETNETSTGKLFFAIVTQATPTYNVNGTIGAIRAKWPVSVTQAGNLLNNVVSATMESRASYENYVGLTLIANSDLAATYDDDEIEFVARTNAYPFFAGTYKWYAFYGEVYS